MSKVAAIAGIVILGFSLVCAQPNAIDSLEEHLKSSPPDSNRVNILNELSQKYLAYKPEMARLYAEEALTLSKQLHYVHGEIVALNKLGEHEYRQSNYARAIEFTMRSLKMAEQAHDSLDMAFANRVLGLTYTFGLKQYDMALQYQLNALKIYEKRKDKRNLATFYGNITWIYVSTNKNLEEAHRLANLGVHLSDSLGDLQVLSYNYNSLGLIYLQENKLDSALYYLAKSNKAAEEVKDKAVIAYNRAIIGKVYLRQRKYDEAIKSFEQAGVESREVNLREVLMQSYDGLAKGYEGLKNYAEAYKNQLLYVQLRDSLVNWETTQKALLTRLEFEEEKAEVKIAELELTNEKARGEQIIYLVLFGIILLFMIVVVLLAARNNRNRKETNRLLKEKNKEIADQNQKLKEANATKDKFFSIISHDLRSPVTSLKGLLGLLLGNEINDEEFKSFAPKLNQRLMGLSETLENLLHWSQSQMRGMTFNPSTHSIGGVIDKCLMLFHETAHEKYIKLINEIPKDTFIYSDKNQTELIFRNFIHNAIKFTPDGGSVTISAKEADEFIEIVVADSGIGMTPEQVAALFRTEQTNSTYGTQGEKGTGLGLLLCKEMIENNGGKLEVRSEVGKGSEFRVWLNRMKNYE